MFKFYKLIAHTADFGIEVKAKSIPDIYVNSAKALFDLIVGVENIEPVLEQEILVEGIDEVDLLIRWLNELIYLFSVKNLLFSNFKIKFLGKKELKCLAKGEEFKKGKHEIKVEIKAATYHNIKIEKKGDFFYTKIIFDV